MDGYLQEICTMIYISRIMTGDRQNRQVDLEVVNVVNGAVERVFTYTPTDDDINPSVQGLGL